MIKLISSHITRKTGSILSLIILCLFLSSAGCIQLPDLGEEVSNEPASPVDTELSPAPEIMPITEEIPGQAFPQDIPPQLRERLIREGKLPSPGKMAETPNIPLTPAPVPVPTSFVTRLGDTLADDAFIPSRSSIYFTNNTLYTGPVKLYPVYSASGIPLNSNVKELEVHVEKGPFSVSYTVHPKSTPLFSWAGITVQDSFQNILHEDGFNREFSSEKKKEFFVYKEGNFIVRLSGEHATLDISINTPDGPVKAPISTTKSEKEIPDNIPPQVRERLMREGKL
jgi:hypothetical protein